MKKLALAILLTPFTANAATDWDEIGKIVAPHLTPNDYIEVCVDGECNAWTYISYEKKDEKKPKKTVEPGTVGQLVDKIIGLGTVTGNVVVSHKTKTNKTNADGSTESTETSTTVEVNVGNR